MKTIFTDDTLMIKIYEPNFNIFTNKEDFDKLKYILWGEE